MDKIELRDDTKDMQDYLLHKKRTGNWSIEHDKILRYVNSVLEFTEE